MKKLLTFATIAALGIALITVACKKEPGITAVTDITGVPSAALIDEPITLTGTVVPNEASNKTIAWTVKDAGTTSATISGSTFNATAQGSATITATIADGKAKGDPFTKDFTITVSVPVESVTLNKTLDTIGIGDTMRLIATVLPEDASNKALTWSGNNNAVATVDNTGLVTAIEEGNVVITATTQDGSNKTATIAMTVILPVDPDTVIISGNVPNPANHNQTVQLTATVLPANASNKSVTWSSSNTARATVSPTGLVTAGTAGGAVTITATTVVGGKTTTRSMNVTFCAGITVLNFPATNQTWSQAGSHCASYGGRLPTTAELNCMYTNRSGIGGFTYTGTNARYWSSTPGTNAYYFRDFSNGNSGYMAASTQLSVRCVRNL